MVDIFDENPDNDLQGPEDDGKSLTILPNDPRFVAQPAIWDSENKTPTRDISKLTLPNEFTWNSYDGITSINGETREPVGLISVVKQPRWSHCVITDEMVELNTDHPYEVNIYQIIKCGIELTKGVLTSPSKCLFTSSLINFNIVMNDDIKKVTLGEVLHKDINFQTILTAINELFVWYNKKEPGKYEFSNQTNLK